jgi:signal transduction histidine kinase
VSFRVRLTVALAFLALVPLLVLGLGIRREMARRLEEQALARARSLADVVRQNLVADRAATRNRLETMGRDLAADSRFRLATSGDSAQRRWLLDWAAPAMHLAGFDFLRVTDSAGRILSSGHFRNEFDGSDGGLAKRIHSTAEGVLLASARRPDTTFPVLLGADSFRAGSRRYALVGGRRLDSARIAELTSGSDIAVALHQGAAPPGLASIEIPSLDSASGGIGRASLVMTPDPELARRLVARLDRWLGAVLGVTLVLAVAAAWWLGRIVSRPVVELAERADSVDLDRLELGFATDRDDEIGTLARGLDRMTSRLRQSAARQRDAERRAAVGELARQVNHDIRNGLVPLRNVFQHLTEAARREPERLGSVFQERQATVDSSLEYLDQLARNYGRLSPAAATESCDANEILEQIARAGATGSITIETRLRPDLPRASADAVALRRIVENLVSNAIDAVVDAPGRIILSTDLAGPSDRRMIRLAVTDTGSGIGSAELERVFDDFYTTKPAGSGLGLSVVRRLVTDLGGRVWVESTRGHGATFTVEIPAG